MQEASVPSSGVLSFKQTVAMQIQPAMIFISLILAFTTLLTHWWVPCSSFVYFLKLSAPFFIIIIFSVMCAVLEGQSDVTDRAILFMGSQATCLWMKKALWTSRDMLSFFIKLPVGQGAWESKASYGYRKQRHTAKNLGRHSSLSESCPSNKFLENRSGICISRVQADHMWAQGSMYARTLPQHMLKIWS